MFVLLTLGWLNRSVIGAYYLNEFCDERGLNCQAEFAELGLNRVRLEHLALQKDAQTPLEAESLEIELRWPAFLTPEVVHVSAMKPVVRAAVYDGRPTLYGLEDVFLSNAGEQNSPSSNVTIPHLNIQGGILELVTDAGNVSGTFDLLGQPLQTGSANLHINPSHLQREDAEITWSKGDIKLMFHQGAVAGDIEFAIELAKLDGLTLTDAELSGKLAEQDEQIAFEFAGSLMALDLHDMHAENIKVQSNGGLTRLQDFSQEAILSALQTMTVALEGENIHVSDVRMSKAQMNADIRQDRAGLTSPVALNIDDLALPGASSQNFSAAGQVSILPGEDVAYQYRGSIVTRQAALEYKLYKDYLGGLVFPEPFLAHGQQLHSALSGALAGFDLGLDLEASYQGEAWSVTADRPTLLRAASGFMLSIDPLKHQSWLQADQDQFLVAGDVSVSGGMEGPSVKGVIDELTLKDADTHLHLRAVELEPWRADGRTVAARIDSLEAGLDERLRLIANGEISLSGAMPGLDLEETRIIGHVSAVQAIEGWRVQTYENTCVGYSSEGMSAGALKFASMTLSLCPVDGRFVRQEEGQSVGQIQLGTLDLPFQTDEARGNFGVDDARLKWVAGDGINLTIEGQRFHLPLRFSEDTLTIEAETPQVSFTLDGGPALLKARLGETVFGGSMVPANVVANAFSFDGLTTQTGIDGAMKAGHVRITDLNADAVYQPLIADLTANLTGGRIVLDGPIRSESEHIEIARTALDLRLADFSGTAQVKMEPLSFAKGGLQPVDLSELLRGVLINASGGISGQADFLIRDGALSGTGHIDMIELIFDTLKAGTVSGVNGRIEFSDILALTTPPGQKVNISFMDPGVPLRDGAFSLQIVEGTTTKLESAAWPFAGGRLEILPTVFTGGEMSEQITMMARELELEKLIEVFRIPDLSASGTISGAFPIDIEGANIMVRNAVLSVDEKGGWLSYTGNVVDAAKGQNAYADYAFDALKDFDFRVMRIGADGNLIGRILLTADLLGKSDDVLDATEFDFGITVDSHLSKLLRTASEATSRTYLSEAIELRRLEAVDEASE